MLLAIALAIGDRTALRAGLRATLDAWNRL
jgi:hypothetical protein